MNGKCILIVDDEAPIREMIVVALEMAGYECLEAENTQQAHALIVDRQPDLILLDIMLPYVDGIELLQQIRQKAGWERCAVIMLTTKSHESDIVRALELGASDYVVKPFQPNELLARIRRHVKPKS